jgi:hypothetical protein
MRPTLAPGFLAPVPAETPVVRRLVTRALVGFIRAMPSRPDVAAVVYPRSSKPLEQLVDEVTDKRRRAQLSGGLV